MKKAIAKGYVLYGCDDNYITFVKCQNYGAGEQMSDCQEAEEVGQRAVGVATQGNWKEPWELSALFPVSKPISWL